MAFLAVLATLSATAITTSTAAAAVPQGFVGVNVDGPLFPYPAPGVDLAGQFDAMVASGVQNIRVVFNWGASQPYKSFKQVPPSQAPQFANVGGVPTWWTPLDTIVGLAAQRGLTILPTVLYTPGWDAAPHPKNDIAIPARDAPYANFLSALVHRYGPKGSFWTSNTPRVPIRGWQIWNEPSLRVYWPKRPFTPGYAALVHAAHDAIKRADSGAKVVLAGLPNFSWVQLNDLYKVSGFGKSFDIVALHPFTKFPSGVITIIGKARAVMNRHGDGRKPIIASEVTWPSSAGQTSHNGGFDFATTPSGEATRISQVLPLLAKNRRKLNLAGFDFYTWAGFDDPGGDPFDFAGLEHYDSGSQSFDAKPALAAYRQAALRLEGCTSKGARATVCVR